MPNIASTQHPVDNRFFGFEFVIEPLAIKWACGGERVTDLARVQMLIDAFPEDAERADVQEIIDYIAKMPDGRETLEVLLWPEFPVEAIGRICTAAAPLNINWLVPETFGSGVEELPDEQRAHWTAFWTTVEAIQIQVYEPKSVD